MGIKAYFEQSLVHAESETSEDQHEDDWPKEMLMETEHTNALKMLVAQSLDLGPINS
jgi:hypothetical protein